MDKSDKLFFVARELSHLVHDGAVSPVEAVEAYLGRIDNLNDRLYACLTVCQEEALEADLESEQAMVRGEKRGPLHGVPFALKDQLNAAGIRHVR